MTTDKCPNCGYTLEHTTVVVAGPRGAVRVQARTCRACGYNVVDHTEPLEDAPQPMDIEFDPFNSI